MKTGRQTLEIQVILFLFLPEVNYLDIQSSISSTLKVQRHQERLLQ
jgi:hypothetical protein